MLCFSEVPKGRDISDHRSKFGDYSLVVSQNWLSNNSADRVLYVGNNSPVSQYLYKNLATMRGLSIYADKKTQLLFQNEVFSILLDLFSYIEVREHLEELEWRIVGKHGFMGGENDTGKTLDISLEEIEYVFVPNMSEVTKFQNVISEVATKDSVVKLPSVQVFPESIPHKKLTSAST